VSDSKMARALFPLIAMAAMMPDPYSTRLQRRQEDPDEVRSRISDRLDKIPSECRARVREFSQVEADAAQHTRHTLEQCVRFNVNNCRDDIAAKRCGANCWLAKAVRKGGNRP
jgi:hypothetical protein